MFGGQINISDGYTNIPTRVHLRLKIVLEEDEEKEKLQVCVRHLMRPLIYLFHKVIGQLTGRATQ